MTRTTAKPTCKFYINRSTTSERTCANPVSIYENDGYCGRSDHNSTRNNDVFGTAKRREEIQLEHQTDLMARPDVLVGYNNMPSDLADKKEELKKERKEIRKAYRELKEADKIVKSLKPENKDARSCLVSARKLLGKAEDQLAVYVDVVEKYKRANFVGGGLRMFINYAELAMFDACLIIESKKNDNIPNYEGQAETFRYYADNRPPDYRSAKYDLDYFGDIGYEHIFDVWFLLKEHRELDYDSPYHIIDKDIHDLVKIIEHHETDEDQLSLITGWVKNTFGYAKVPGVRGIGNPVRT